MTIDSRLGVPYIGEFHWYDSLPEEGLGRLDRSMSRRTTNQMCRKQTVRQEQGPDIPAIRNLSPAEAKAEITRLVTRRPRLDYLDIANELNLDLGFTIQI